MTAITRHGRSPNYAFRVSVSDEYADEFLVRYALEVLRAQHPGIIADTSAWGEANVTGLLEWLHRYGVVSAPVARFDQGETNMTNQLERLQAGGVDALLLVANATEGAAIVRGLSSLGWKPQVLSHWGMSGGRFVELAGVSNTNGVYTLQTYSFFGPLSEKGAAVLQAYHAHFGTRYPEEIKAPVGVAHGYDGVHLLAQAVQLAGTTTGPQLRHALEHLPPYDGLLKRYEPAFTPERHGALLADDCVMTVWQGGHLIPVPQSGLGE